MNLVCINGRLASDPEGGESGQKVAYARFSVAIERGSGESKQVTFLDVVTFRQQADFVRQYFHKGDGINIVGSISVRDFEDSSGVKRRKFEIVATQVSFPASGKGRGTQQSGRAQREAPPRNGGDPVGAAKSSGYDSYESYY